MLAYFVNPYLSFFVASLIYPSYRQYLNQQAPVSMTMPATEPSTASPGVSVFNCDQVVYLSAFITLTVMYLLILVFLVISVGLFIASRVAVYHQIFLDDIPLFAVCCRALKCGEADNTTGEEEAAEETLPVALH